MIQRIQSVFLATTVIIGIVLFFVPFSTKSSINSEKGNPVSTQLVLSPSANSTQSETNSLSVNYILLVLNLVTFSAAAFTIFQYNNRNAQIRICSLNGLFTGVFLALIFYFSDQLPGEGKPHYDIGTYLVAIQVFLLLAARRFIRKDEMLVRASQRIR